MATFTGTQIVARARFLSQDTDPAKYRDSDPDMLAWLNEATRALCELVPAESLSTEDLVLVAGAKQTIPARATALVDVVRNVDGNAVTPTSRELLDVFTPGWQTMANASSIVHYIPSAKNPKVFHTYPPATAGVELEVVLAVPPAEMAALTETIKVNDTYAAALINYVLFRLYSKDAEDAANAALAKGYYDAFRAASGGGA